MIAYIINRQPETETKGKAQKIKENPQNESTPIDVHYLATEPALAAYAYNPSTQEAQTSLTMQRDPVSSFPTPSTFPIENLVLRLLRKARFPAWGK